MREWDVPSEKFSCPAKGGVWALKWTGLAWLDSTCTFNYSQNYRTGI